MLRPFVLVRVALKMKMRMEQWDDCDKGKQRYSERSLCQRQDGQQKFWARIRTASVKYFFFSPMPPHVLLNFVVCPLAVA
jgi:hypothetical protein